MTEGSKVTGMKGKKKLPELPLALQSRDAGVGSARAQPPAPESPLSSVGCASARSHAGPRGDGTGPDGTRGPSRGGGQFRSPHSTAAPGRPFLPRLPPAPPLAAGRATLHPAASSARRGGTGRSARTSVAKRGVPRGAETFLQIAAAERPWRTDPGPGLCPPTPPVEEERRG